MAKLYISEYSIVQRDEKGMAIPVAMEPALLDQVVAIGAEADSVAFLPETKYIRVHADAICSILIGSGNPVATTDSKRLAANTTEYFGVRPGYKLSVISNT